VWNIDHDLSKIAGGIPPRHPFVAAHFVENGQTRPSVWLAVSVHFCMLPEWLADRRFVARVPAENTTF